MRDIEISIQELRHGGYIVFEGAGDERRPLMAKTTLAETASAVRDMVEERLAPETGECWQTGDVSMPKAITNVVPLRPRGLMERIFGRG